MHRPTTLLLVVASAFVLGIVAVVVYPGRRVAVTTTQRPERVLPAAVVRAADFLPSDAALDGSVDYRVQMQAALDAATGRTLELPPFRVLVGAAPGKNYCLFARGPIAIRGGPGSELVERTGRVQLLRFEDVARLRLSDFVLRGHGGVGDSLAHGTLQVTGGSDVRIEGVTVLDADCDGIVVANAADVRIEGCRVERASKAGIYVTNCDRSVVVGNVVVDTLGHRVPDGRIVGAGIQLLSNRELSCSANVVAGGVGVGILCGANVQLGKPFGNSIVGNRVSGYSNPTNPDASGGIQLANANRDRATDSLVASNSIHGCGAAGLRVENHDAAAIVGNRIVASERSGLVVGTTDGLWIDGNTVLNSNTTHSGGQAGIFLIRRGRQVALGSNDVRQLRGLEPGTIDWDVFDESGNAVVAGRGELYAEAPPVSGEWRAGTRLYDPTPTRGAPLGWVCTAGGEPGLWAPFALVE